MAVWQRTLSLFWHFISVSSWSPSIVFIAAAAVVLLFRVRPSWFPWKFLAACLCLATCASACIYLVIPTLQDYVEAGVAAVSALALRGWPMYPALGTAHLYLAAYGPLTYAARIPFYWLFGTTLFAFKLPGILAFFLGTAGLYRICRHYAPPSVSLLGLGCCFLLFLRFIPLAFWGRGDPFLICMTALCIWAVLEAPSWVVVLTAASTFALLPNIKITAGAYLFPIVWLLFIRKGWKLTGRAIILGLVLFSLPFVSSQVSLANYWLSLNNSRHALRIDLLWRNVQYSAILLLPLVSMLLCRRKNKMTLSRDQAIYIALAFCSLIAACFTGANFGSGPYHLLPCLAPLLYLYFWLRSELPVETPVWSSSRLSVVCTVSMLVFSAVNVRTFLITLGNARRGRDAIAEIRSVEHSQLRETVEVGVGKDFNDFRTVYAAVTALDGQPFTTGALAIQELQVAGVEIPDSTIRYMENCGTRNWLIPKNDVPFTAPDLYFNADHPAFRKAFQNAFLDHYRKTGSGRFYDVWACANNLPAAH